MTESLPILTSEAMHAADRAAQDAWGLPGRMLMETAGRAAAAQIARRWPPGGLHVAVLCGPGHNGGDGLVVARELHRLGATVEVALVRADGLPPSAAANLALVHRLADARLRVLEPGEPPTRPDVVVDALLGVGHAGALRGAVGRWARWAAEAGAPVVALDLPTGLDGTTGTAAEGTPRARLTLAMGALKVGHVLGDGPARCGETLVLDVGIPEPELRARASAVRLTDAGVTARLPRRAADAHKHAAGRVLVVAGSRAFPGAAVLAATAALRAGAGVVTVATAESARAAVDAGSVEAMTVGLPETDAGTLAAGALGALRELAARADALVVGCGLGRHAETSALVRDLLGGLALPAVVDADGLRAVAPLGPDALGPGARVLTPHAGELAALLGADPPADRLVSAPEFAARWNTTVLWKGMPSIAAAPDGRAVVGPPPETALATAGTGDVLAGTVGAFLAQGIEPLDAVACALHVGSAAAAGRHGVVASDLPARYPSVFARLLA